MLFPFVLVSQIFGRMNNNIALSDVYDSLRDVSVQSKNHFSIAQFGSKVMLFLFRYVIEDKTKADLIIAENTEDNEPIIDETNDQE